MSKKFFTSLLLFAFTVLLANACFATSYNKKPNASFNASSDSVYDIEYPFANVNEQTNKPTSAYSDSHFWIKSQFGARCYYHYLQNATAEKVKLSDKKI